MKVSDFTQCSACFQQHPEKVHVDFEVAWDGPHFPEGSLMTDDGKVNHLPVQIDDLILCEDCVRSALMLVPDPRDEVVQAAQARVVAAERALAGQVNLSAKLTDALDVKVESDQLLEVLGFEVVEGEVEVGQTSGRRRRRK